MTDMLPGLAADPDDVIREARELHSPVRSFCLFSGGHDSTVLAHRCREHYDELAFIDTGTALPGVREFVESFAADVIGKPLRVLEAGDAYRTLVLELGGFPGPAGHGRAYTRLKERQIEVLVREAKKGHPRTARIMLLTGKRRAESARRRKTTKGVERRGAQLWTAPLVDWTGAQMRAYRAEHHLPESDVAALLHRSGECQCGAFAAPGEREELRSLFPTWWDETIAPLEAEAERRGVAACRWGVRPPRKVPIYGDLQPCASCSGRGYLTGDDGARVECGTCGGDGRDAPIVGYRTVAGEESAPAGPMCSDCQLRLDDLAVGA